MLPLIVRPSLPSLISTEVIDVSANAPELYISYPILVTVDGITSLPLRLLHPLNAPSPIVLNLSLSVILVNSTSPLNASAPIVNVFSENTTFFIDVFINALSYILRIYAPAFNVIFSRLLSFLKAPSQISETFDDKLTSVKDLQSENA